MSIYPAPNSNSSNVFNEKDYTSPGEETSTSSDTVDHSNYLLKSGGLLSGTLIAPHIEFYDSSIQSTAFSSTISDEISENTLKLSGLTFDDNNNLTVDKLICNSVSYQGDTLGGDQIYSYSSVDKAKLEDVTVDNTYWNVDKKIKCTKGIEIAGTTPLIIGGVIQQQAFSQSYYNKLMSAYAKLEDVMVDLTHLNIDKKVKCLEGIEITNTTAPLIIGGVIQLQAFSQSYYDKLMSADAKLEDVSYLNDIFSITSQQSIKLNSDLIEIQDILKFSDNSEQSEAFLSSYKPTLESVTLSPDLFKIDRKIEGNGLNIIGDSNDLNGYDSNGSLNLNIGISSNNYLQIKNYNPNGGISLKCSSENSVYKPITIDSKGIHMWRNGTHIGYFGGYNNDTADYYIQGNWGNNIIIKSGLGNVLLSGAKFEVNATDFIVNSSNLKIKNQITMKSKSQTEAFTDDLFNKLTNLDDSFTKNDCVLTGNVSINSEIQTHGFTDDLYSKLTNLDDSFTKNDLVLLGDLTLNNEIQTHAFTDEFYNNLSQSKLYAEFNLNSNAIINRTVSGGISVGSPSHYHDYHLGLDLANEGQPYFGTSGQITDDFGILNITTNVTFSNSASDTGYIYRIQSQILVTNTAASSTANDYIIYAGPLVGHKTINTPSVVYVDFTSQNSSMLKYLALYANKYLKIRTYMQIQTPTVGTSSITANIQVCQN